MTIQPIIEPNEWLRIETGIPGNDQESSFMNATLQGTAELEFSVECHIGIPASVVDEVTLVEHLVKTLLPVTLLNRGIAFSIQTGPSGSGEDDE